MDECEFDLDADLYPLPHCTPPPPKKMEVRLIPCITSSRSSWGRSWGDLESLGYTPDGVVRMMETALELIAQRRNIVATCNKYMEEARVLRARLLQLEKEDADPG